MIRARYRIPALVLSAVLSASGAGDLRWLPDSGIVEVTGIAGEQLPAQGAPPETWSARLAVRSADGAPPMLGTWSVEGDRLRFQPRFPLLPGLTYTAAWTPLTGTPATVRHTVPVPAAAGTRLIRVDPGGSTVPENLLKFYLHFSGPMSGGGIYQHLHLRNAAGREVDLPFLELAEELWNPDMTRLTLFIDPGRVKREVKPLEEIGPALVAGGEFTLTIDAAWPDAAGRPLLAAAEQKFKVVAPDRTPPDPRLWKITAPAPATREPLRLTFSEPMDHALSLRLITIRGRTGRAALDGSGTAWTFVPDAPWTPGAGIIDIRQELEDLAGNSIGKPFEVDITESGQAQSAPGPAELPFVIPAR